MHHWRDFQGIFQIKSGIRVPPVVQPYLVMMFVLVGQGGVCVGKVVPGTQGPHTQAAHTHIWKEVT